MIKETYFFRDLENLKILETKTKEKSQNNKIKSKYDVIDTIELTEGEFLNFSKNFKRNYKFLYKYIDSMKIDKNGIWQCIEIVGNNKKILILNNGYSYPRFTGLVL